MELLHIRTQQFEGPLDLMLFLIQKNELDISSISLHAITDQYVQYVNLMRDLDFDLASEFLLMASVLIFLKSKRLLPDADEEVTANTEEEAPPTEAELVARLKRYQMFQDAAERLLALPRLNDAIFTKPDALPPEKQTIWKELDLSELTLALHEVLRRSRRRTRVIIRDSISIPERITKMASTLKVDTPQELFTLIPDGASRSEICGTFIAALEMSRLKKLKIYQAEAFGPIYLTMTEDVSSLDPKLVTGFQYRAHQSIEELVAHGAS